MSQCALRERRPQGGDIETANGLNIPEPGCWEVTAVYKGASLSYVVWVGGE